VDPDALVLDLGDANLPLSAAQLFGAARPLEVELGAGNGRFLLESAAAHPERGYLGVERARKYLELAATRARRRGLVNVRLAHTTAEDLLFRCLTPGSVAALHVYFPDPWPKKRHHKRRFFRAENVARLAEVLEPGGVLRVKTDHPDYGLLIAGLLAAEPLLVADGDPALFAGLPATHFELRYARDARPVHRFACLRR